MKHDHGAHSHRHPTNEGRPGAAEPFPTAVAGLAQAQSTELVELTDGARFDMRIAPVAKKIGDATVRMLAYNQSIPGPTLRVRQGSHVWIDVTNDGDMADTVHWHGLRVENRYDGTHETQPPIAVGSAFSYRLTFPDAGIYWYHPHVREDYGQEMGLYGNIIVVPEDADYWPRADREICLTLDDILLEDGKVAPFSPSESTYTAMGRFGNVLLVNGETELALSARPGEVVRFYMTDTANTRVFNVGFRGARMKRVGGDSGRVEHEEFVEQVVIAPSERVVVDVLFDKPGRVLLEHRTPDRTYSLGTITVAGDPVQTSAARSYSELRTDADLVAERARIASALSAPPHKTLAFVAEMDMGEPAAAPGTTIVYVCPMHPKIRRDEPGRCPKCWMKLIAESVASAAAAEDHHQHGSTSHAQPAHEPAGEHGSSDASGIEWEDDMVDVNRMTTPANMRWKLVDRTTGAVNAAIDWRFRVGDVVKIRLLNEMDSDHPMHHPFHIHGAGRFLVLSRDGVAETNLVWKDTVLVPTGQTVDILLDVSNAGRWMAHCHIAEHHEGGMMFTFIVDR